MFQPIGFLVILAGLFGLVRGHGTLVALIIMMSVLGAASALYIGDMDVGPAQLLILFAGLSLMVRPSQISTILGVMQPPKPGFWFACFVIYAVATSFVLPVILGGTTMIVPLDAVSAQNVSAVIPLQPLSSNFTQAVYLTGGLVCFCLVKGAASTREGFRTMFFGVLLYCVLNAIAAIADLVTFNTGTSHLLDFIRNARYNLLVSSDIGGLKRIAGSFTEASAFGRATTGAFAFCATLWICKRHRRITAPVALISLVFIVISTSSAAWAVLPVVLGLLLLTSLGQSNASAAGQGVSLIIAGGVLVLAVAAGSALLLNERVSAVISDYTGQLVFNKMSTESGVERASFNTAGLRNFVETWGLGVGLGTSRSSSFVIALLANTGVIGFILYSAFLFSIVFDRSRVALSYPGDIKLAARNALIGMLAIDSLVASTIDQGFMYYAVAALMAAQPDAAPAYDPAPRFRTAHARHG